MPKHPQISQEFVSLLTDHQEVIRSYIISQVPGSPDVRDILQEVNIRLWEKMNDFQLGTNFGAWACTVAYYKILDYRKKQKRNGFLIFNDELCETLAKEAEERHPEQFEQKRQALQQCLKQLSQANQELIQARYEDSSNNMAQISQTSGRSRASLRVTLSRLRATLRQCINKRLKWKGDPA
ncbi:sigma-70 family RNA polymerase sigma factor [Verrucomicrobiaceae bacterium N1E253]|uniref:Sigma-70 family RNA polymerase sigma factor n=1 Tax=Oceaniferula marina TaxID=2748318 RepID=A0A851GNU2_9BACT|nr:sigma-70 family RNA polymerase sigma factor [Oceaniferula marina]NWK55804.1 sigma-70 family RNA polymerase sigma factor [Oceaniferula marina]